MLSPLHELMEWVGRYAILEEQHETACVGVITGFQVGRSTVSVTLISAIPPILNVIFSNKKYMNDCYAIAEDRDDRSVGILSPLPIPSSSTLFDVARPLQSVKVVFVACEQIYIASMSLSYIFPMRIHLSLDTVWTLLSQICDSKTKFTAEQREKYHSFSVSQNTAPGHFEVIVSGSQRETLVRALSLRDKLSRWDPETSVLTIGGSIVNFQMSSFDSRIVNERYPFHLFVPDLDFLSICILQGLHLSINIIEEDSESTSLKESLLTEPDHSICVPFDEGLFGSEHTCKSMWVRAIVDAQRKNEEENILIIGEYFDGCQDGSALFFETLQKRGVMFLSSDLPIEELGSWLLRAGTCICIHDSTCQTVKNIRQSLKIRRQIFSLFSEREVGKPISATWRQCTMQENWTIKALLKECSPHFSSELSVSYMRMLRYGGIWAHPSMQHMIRLSLFCCHIPKVPAEP